MAVEQNFMNQYTNRLILLSGTGHCGTHWFVSTFTCHEDRNIFLNESQHASLQIQGELQKIVPYASFGMRGNILNLFLESSDFISLRSYQNYWNILHNLPYNNVGISFFVGNPDLMARIYPVMHKIKAIGILLVRNGIKVVNSIFNHSKNNYGWYDSYMCTYAAPVYLRKYWGKEVHTKLDLFESICIYWATCYYSALKSEKVAGIETVTLENLVNDKIKFRKIWTWVGNNKKLSDEKIAKLQAHDINRKKDIKYREINSIWKNWSCYQRKTFEKICSDAMAYFGYKLPTF